MESALQAIVAFIKCSGSVNGSAFLWLLLKISKQQPSVDEMFQEPAVLSLAEKYRKTPAQILLRFLTQKDIIVIPRSTNPEHIRENFDLFDFKLTTAEMAQLSALDKKEPLIGRPETPELVEFSLTW